jgi:DNA polymerase I-like protein with 3'-5' exonuclease and polymerase domains
MAPGRMAAGDSVTEARTIIGRRLLPNADTNWARFGLFTNYRVQGSAADLIKGAMVKLAGILPSDAHLVATVHDESILDVPGADAIQLRVVTQYAMEDAFKELFGDTIPVEVDAKVCANWVEK